jgi:hypothetical protein
MWSEHRLRTGVGLRATAFHAAVCEILNFRANVRLVWFHMFRRLHSVLAHIARSKPRTSEAISHRILWNLNRFCTANRGLGDQRDARTVSIGDVCVDVVPGDPRWVPRGRLGGDIGDTSRGASVVSSRLPLSQEVLGHLRWLMQKDNLGQDVCLVGPPGSRRRRLALAYCELVGREYEFVSITRDTTEADLKQRREIVSGNALYSDQAPVRAALEGRVLVLEGIEKAERNVIPTLNNLLENREMALDDGRFLMR